MSCLMNSSEWEKKIEKNGRTVQCLWLLSVILFFQDCLKVNGLEVRIKIKSIFLKQELSRKNVSGKAPFKI